MSLKRTVKETEFVVVDDGLHSGRIIGVEEKMSKAGYARVNLIIAVEDEENGKPKYTYTDSDGDSQLATLSASFADNVSTKSDLGFLIAKLNGGKLDAGKEIDLELALHGKRISFMTQVKPMVIDGEEREIVNVIRDSIKPLIGD